MDLDRLREFVVIAESGSIREAASRLDTAPNVLSTRLKAFENSIGSALITRNAHVFELTDSGRLLYEQSGDLLGSYDRLLLSVKENQGSSFRSLKLLLCAQTLASELGPFLDRYCRRYPNLLLGLYDENSCRIYEGIRSGKADIAFVVGRENDFCDFSGRVVLNKFPLMRVHVPYDHRLAKAGNVSFADLNGETFVLYPDMHESFTRDLQLSMLEQSGIRYQIYEEEYSPFFYDLLVPIGKGIRLWNWNDMRMAPNTSLLTIRDEGYETYLYMLYSEDSSNETVAHFVRKFLEFRKERK